MHLEAVLHTEVYKARPDVGAVIHGHPPHATALAACQAELSLLTHDAVLFADGLALFEDTPELITGPQLGQAVARALGARRVVLMRNHGVLVVGKDLGWAVLAAVPSSGPFASRRLRPRSGRSSLSRPSGPSGCTRRSTRPPGGRVLGGVGAEGVPPARVGPGD